MLGVSEIVSSGAPVRLVGIDPGKTGGVVFLDHSPGGSVGLEAYPVPVLASGTKGRKMIDVPAVVRLIQGARAVSLLDGRPVFAVMERAGARPREAPGRAFAFGQVAGILETALVAAGIPYSVVNAEAWKRALGVPAAKDGAVARAGQIFPTHAHLFHGPRGGIKDGIAEAAMIAWYGLRL